jgi:DNA replication protein DnaC
MTLQQSLEATFQRSDEDQKVINTLMKIKSDDQTIDRIATMYPPGGCPTCNGRMWYRLDFVQHPCDCQLQIMLQKHYFRSNIGREYHDICLKDFDGPDSERVVDAVRSYLDKYEDNFHYGLGLTFTGPYGTGKTFAMTCVLKELVKQGRDTYFTTFEQLINVWGDSWHDANAKKMLEEKLKTVEVLGLDELRTDARNAGGFLQNGLDSVIRYRTANLLPTLITTNMSSDFEKSEFAKVYSLLAAKNTRVETHGHDRRMLEVRQRNHELKERGERRPVC